METRSLMGIIICRGQLVLRSAAFDTPATGWTTENKMELIANLLSGPTAKTYMCGAVGKSVRLMIRALLITNLLQVENHDADGNNKVKPRKGNHNRHRSRASSWLNIQQGALATQRHFTGSSWKKEDASYDALVASASTHSQHTAEHTAAVAHWARAFETRRGFPSETCK